jgi:hypothetical protein
MNEAITWQNLPITVQARRVPRYFWTTSSIDVFLAGQCVLRTGGQMKLTGSYSASFAVDGVIHTVELSWGTGYLWSFPYKLQIDGAPVAESRVYVQNWPLGFALMLLVASFFGILLGAALIVLHHLSTNPAVLQPG